MRGRARVVLAACLATAVAASSGAAAHGGQPPILDVHARPLGVHDPRMPVASARLAVDAPVLAVIFGQGNQPPSFERTVYFRFRKATPKKPQSVGRIAAAIDQLGSVGGLRIDGFTDAIGKKPYNKQLSIRRACAVAHELTRLLDPPVPPLAIRAFGETHPVASNTRDDGSDDPIGRARNRRVDVEVVDRPLRSRIVCGWHE